MMRRNSRVWRVSVKHCRSWEVVEHGAKSSSTSNLMPIRKVSCRYIHICSKLYCRTVRSTFLKIRNGSFGRIVAGFFCDSRISTVHTTGLSEITVALFSRISLLVLTNPPNSVIKSSNLSEKNVEGYTQIPLEPL